MIDVNKLLDSAIKACGYTTDTQLAKHLKVRHSAVSNWRNGRNQPDVVSAAELARLTGEKLQSVIAAIEESRAKSAKAKAVWRQIASAAIICLAIYTSIPNAIAVNHSDLTIDGQSRHCARFGCRACIMLARLTAINLLGDRRHGSVALR